MGFLHRLLILHEGLRLKPYKCSAGKWTIGVGHNFEDNGFPFPILLRILDEGFTCPIALDLLSYDISEARKNLAREPWFARLDEVRREALTDMCFNLGWPAFSAFHNMIEALEKGDFETAADEMFDSKWAFQVGDGPGRREDRADRLAYMVRTGQRPQLKGV